MDVKRGRGHVSLQEQVREPAVVIRLPINLAKYRSADRTQEHPLGSDITARGQTAGARGNYQAAAGFCQRVQDRPQRLRLKGI